MTPDDARLGDPPGDTNPIAALERLRAELHALRREVTDGMIAPKAVDHRLGLCADHIHDALVALARQDGLGVARDTAATALLDLLTPRERDVASAVISHGTTARAAHALGMTDATLGHHRSNILRKLRVSTFAQVARLIAATPLKSV